MPARAAPPRRRKPPAAAPAAAVPAGRGAPGAITAPRRRKVLKGISDIRRFFHRQDTPIYFISATNFNLLGMDEWVRNFSYINLIDCFDGHHPSVFVPPEVPHQPFTSIEDINNYLLGHPAVIDHIRGRAAVGGAAAGSGELGKAVFLMFDEQTERLCEQIGLSVAFPAAALRQRVDDKINTTRIADRAGVRSVPNVLARVDSYDSLRKAARRLGEDLVVQTAYGDSGHTTFFISSEKDFREHEREIVEAPEVKIMKRIRCRGSALEACVTRHGTIVGPLMTELIGFRELTPYRGGWCGNEVFAGAFDRKVRNRAKRMAMRFGDELRTMGYKGYFELDFLTDLDSGAVYLGEVNPRLTGASSMTNLAAFAHADAPLFLFHLLEYMNVPYQLDVDELNERWADPDNIDTWSQLVVKHTEDTVDRVTVAPRSGIWESQADGSARFLRVQTHRRTVQFDDRAFWLRIIGPGDYRYEGADLGVLVSRGRFMDDEHRLSPRAKTWVRAVRGQYGSAPVRPDNGRPAHAPVEIGAFKIY